LSTRKKKPGPKRPIGRPKTAVLRAQDRERLAEEKRRLEVGGYRKITVVVEADMAAHLLEESPVKRLEGLVKSAELSGDACLALELRARLQIAEGKRNATRQLRYREQLRQLDQDGIERAREIRANQEATRSSLSPFGYSKSDMFPS